MRRFATWLLIGCADGAMWIAARLKGGAQRMVANDLNGRHARHNRSDGK